MKTNLASNPGFNEKIREMNSNGKTCNVIGPLLLNWIYLIPAWINNHMPNKLWDGIIYPFPNFNGYTVKFESG